MSRSPENARRRASPWAGCVYPLLLVLAVIVVIESGRRTGIPVPAPFLLLFGSVALAAGLAGLRAGLAAATLSAVFIVYSAIHQFGPSSLTGSIFTLLVGSTIAFVVAFLIGHARDARLALTDELRAAQAELLKARNELAEKVIRRNSELVEVNQELSSVRNRLDTAIEQSPAGVFVIGPDGTVKTANPALRRMFKLDASVKTPQDAGEFLSKYEFYSVTGERFGFGHGPMTDALKTGKVTDHFEFRLVHGDGSFSWLRGSFGPILTNDNSVAGAIAIVLDITAAKHAEGAMRELSRQLMQVQEKERSSLAHELQDEIGQHLTALHMNLHALKKDPDNPPLLEVSIGQVADLTTTVRNLSVELRPAMLDDLGLVAALHWFLGKQEERTGYPISLSADVDPGELRAELVTAIFRVVQEAVSNAIRHAECQAIAVRMYNDGDSLCVTIADDGQGFNVQKRGSGQPQDLRLGLLSMRERVTQLEGNFGVRSELGRGTTITARFPLR